MALSLLLLNSLTLHSLSWAGWLCFLYSVLRIAGIKPVMLLSKRWQSLKARIKESKFAWPVAPVRMKSLAINCAVAIVVALIVYPLAYRAGQHSRDSSSRSNYAKELEAWKQRSARWQRDYDAFMLKQKELNQ